MKPVWIRGVAAICLLVISSGNAHGASESTWQLWDSYKAHFMTADGRIVDWSAEERTTSEGESYALFFALTANDRASFDLILSWTQEHLAKGSLQENLPSWLWKRSSAGKWEVADINSASDADLWIAYTLIQAGKLWRELAYSTLGREMAQHIASEEVVQVRGNKFLLLPGRTGFNPVEGTYFANPSYAPLQLLTALGNEFPDGPWRGLVESTTDQLSANVGHGFAMDWVRLQVGSGFSAVAAPSTPGQGFGSYDAIRVYLWAGMLDPQAPGRNQVLGDLSGMKAYLETHKDPPERISCDGTVVSAKSPVGFSAAVAPFLTALGDSVKSKAQLARLESERVSSTGLYGSDQSYYDQNLALFSRGWSEGSFRFNAQGQLQVRWKAS
jgi:endoglucanase